MARGITNGSGEERHPLTHYQQDFALIDGGVCFVLADGTERIVFANQKVASIYECEDAESFLKFCSAKYQNLMTEEDYVPLAEAAGGNPEHIPLSFQYQTRNGHFRRAQGTGTLKETSFGLTYVLLLFSAEQISSDMKVKDKTGVLGMHDFFKTALLEARKRLTLPSVRALCPVSFNLTNFKEYNRMHGMHQGDLCLKNVAKTITGCFPGALVGHMTADYFAALLPSEELESKLEYVCNEVNFYIGDDGIQLKAGIYRPSEKDTMDDLRHGFDSAKIACDSIKSDGNSSVAVYRPEMGETLANKIYVLRHFTEALEKHYIKVHYQPVIRTLTEKLCGFEALARWEDPEKGMIFPNVFIPVLEEAQMIHRLDRYVLEQVCRMTRDRLDNGLPLVPISMNLSSYDFDVATPLDTIEMMVKRYKIPRTVLHFEITERVVFRNHISMPNTVHKFQQAGYQVWMDDFGSEYSSLNSLHNYHFDVIKIDMGFFSHFDFRSRQIITSVVMMARMLGVQTLAEGVETKEQVAFLKKIGCGRIQGYYYGKPMQYDDTISLIYSRGLQLETPEEAHLMAAAESVNIISDSPTAVFSFDGTNVSLLIENDAYKRELRSAGTQGREEANANLMDQGYPFRGRFQQLMWKAFRSKAPETITYADYGQYMRTSVRWIAGDEQYWVGEAHLYNISNNEAIQQSKMLDRTLRDIFQLYDGFYLLERGKKEVVVLRSSHSELEQRTPYGIDAFIRFFSENLVYPDDRERFLSFIRPENVEATAKSGDGASAAEILRIKGVDGTYRWEVFEALLLYKSATKNILLCERKNVWEKKSDRGTLLPEFCKSFGLSEIGTARPETLAESSLFRMLCETSPYLFYWENKEGRILGASRSLQEVEGVHDASEFAGKTEKEIGCHFNADELRLNEKKPQQTGDSSYRVEELALVGGRIREVSVERRPWYLEKEIAGTLVMVDEAGRKDNDEESRLGLVDQETGFLSFRGAIEAGLLFADDYRLYKHDYVGFLIDVPAFADVMQDSRDNAREILRKISDSIRTTFTSGWTIARIGLCCFLCFTQRESAENVEEKLAAVSGTLPLLWRQLGIQANPLLTHATAYGSEVMSLDEMLQLLIRRMNSAEKAVYGEKPYTEDRIYVRRDVLDSIPEYVIISDPKTYELVYLNKAARQDFGFSADSGLKGCHCYKVLEDFDEPCQDCPNMMLRMDSVLPEIRMNHKTGEKLMVRSFLILWERRTLKMTVAFDVNEYINTLAGDRDLLYQEMTANDAISSGMEEKDPEKAVKKTMTRIAEYMHPERFLIFEERDDETVSATYEWTASGVVPLKDELQSIPKTELRELYIRFVSKGMVMVKDMEVFQKEHPDFSLRIHGVRSFISGQLLLENQTEGFTLVINPSEESFRSGTVTYSTLTDFIAVMVRNRNILQALKKESTIDPLTGAGNRRALERRIQAWQGDGVLGVISVDLNGLKNTNDSEGHHAGDMMISETARILMECAGENYVFRTGGDEFVVVTEDLEERDILLLIQNMRDSANINGISMAIGYAWIRGKVSDFDALLTKADFNMYRDKGHSFRRRLEDELNGQRIDEVVSVINEQGLSIEDAIAKLKA